MGTKIILDQVAVKTAISEYLNKRMVGSIEIVHATAELKPYSSMDVGVEFSITAEFTEKSEPQCQPPRPLLAPHATPVGSVEGRGNTANAVA